MRRATLVCAALLVVGHQPALAQRGGMGGRPGMEPGFGRERQLEAPKLPGPELDGPPDTAAMRERLDLTAGQSTQYGVARDSFMLATLPLRDSARATQDVMYQRLDSGDRVAAMFYAERLQEIGKSLKQRQDRFESRLFDILTGDQVRAYRDWKREQEQLAEARQRDETLRWRGAAFGGDRPAAVEIPVFIAAPGVAQPDVGSAAIRVGRTVYVSSQIAVDQSGTLVGEGDLQAQSARAFDNLTAVLAAARALPSDVVRLTVYVVNYRPEYLPLIRGAAGSAYFPARHSPVTTMVGVQSLSREGLLIAVEATAVTARGGGERDAGEPVIGGARRRP
ncbi:MAG TPA: RidA family protein [Gemmatimonadales bacterium]